MCPAVLDVCHGGVVPYECDEQARQEAADYPVNTGQIGRLQGQFGRTAAELGKEGVRGHEVRFSVMDEHDAADGQRRQVARAVLNVIGSRP